MHTELMAEHCFSKMRTIMERIKDGERGPVVTDLIILLTLQLHSLVKEVKQ